MCSVRASRTSLLRARARPHTFRENSQQRLAAARYHNKVVAAGFHQSFRHGQVAGVCRQFLPAAKPGHIGGNTADSDGLKPMIGGYQTKHDPERGRNYPVGKVHADKAYDRPHLRRWLRGRRIAVRIARIGVEPSDRLGRHRWVIERTLAWLSGYRRLNPRYERHHDNYLAFLGLAAAIVCHKRLAQLTT